VTRDRTLAKLRGWGQGKSGLLVGFALVAAQPGGEGIGLCGLPSCPSGST